MIEQLRELCEDKAAFDKIVAGNKMTIEEWSEVNGMTEADFVTYIMCSVAALAKSRMIYNGSHDPVRWVAGDDNESMIIHIMRMELTDDQKNKH